MSGALTSEKAAPSRASPDEIARAYAHCGEVVRRSAKSFYMAFAILPRETRACMFAAYAFCREADDIVDEGGTESEKRVRLQAFRDGLERCFEGRPEGPIFTALADAAGKRSLSKRHLAHVIDGCEMDLATARYERFEDLAVYLDRVASAVGRVTMEVCGVDPARYPDYGVAGGYAIQLTNVIRDVREDAARGRIYLPQEDLRRFGVAEGDLALDRPTDAVRELLRFEVRRNREWYAKARAGIDEGARRAVLPLTAIVKIYSALLSRIEARDGDVFSTRVAVPGWRKAWIGLSCLVRARLGLPMGA